jgi:hypothetical protein
MHRTEKERFSVRSILSRLSRVPWKTKERSELVGHHVEARSPSRRLRLDGSFYGLFVSRVQAVTMTHDELSQYVAETFDPDLIVEILELTSEELLDAFKEQFIQKKAKFIDPTEEEEDLESW